MKPAIKRAFFLIARSKLCADFFFRLPYLVSIASRVRKKRFNCGSDFLQIRASVWSIEGISHRFPFLSEIPWQLTRRVRMNKTYYTMTRARRMKMTSAEWTTSFVSRENNHFSTRRSLARDRLLWLCDALIDAQVSFMKSSINNFWSRPLEIAGNENFRSNMIESCVGLWATLHNLRKRCSFRAGNEEKQEEKVAYNFEYEMSGLRRSGIFFHPRPD